MMSAIVFKDGVKISPCHKLEHHFVLETNIFKNPDPPPHITELTLPPLQLLIFNTADDRRIYSMRFWKHCETVQFALLGVYYHGSHLLTSSFQVPPQRSTLEPLKFRAKRSTIPWPMAMVTY